MTIDEARNILGATSADNLNTIKIKFRKMMTKYHPDAVGSDAPEHIKKAQLINEAYALILKTGITNECGDPLRKWWTDYHKTNHTTYGSGTHNSNNKARNTKEFVWRGKINESAFVERTIYIMADTWNESKKEFYKVAKGRYMWNPDMEEFECFLKSLNQAVLALLETTERQNAIYNDYEYNIKEKRFEYQVQLFHLLAGQFISPLSCLKKLALPDTMDSEGRSVYIFQTFLGTKGSGTTFTAMSKLKAGDMVYATSLNNNRIMIANDNGCSLGHLSLADDKFYYVIIPILQKHMAQVKFIVREIEIRKTSRPYQIKINVDLYMRMEGGIKDEPDNSQNLKIASLINGYDGYLKSLKNDFS